MRNAILNTYFSPEKVRIKIMKIKKYNKIFILIGFISLAIFFFLYKAPVVFFLLNESFEENKPVKLKYKINCRNSEIEWEEELYRNIIPITKEIYLSPGIHQLEIQKENEIIFKQKIFVLYKQWILVIYNSKETSLVSVSVDNYFIKYLHE